MQNLGKDSIGLCTDEGLYIFFAGECRYRLIDPRTSTKPSPKVLSVFKDHHGELWMFGDTPGVVRYNLVTEDKQHYITPKEDLPNAERVNRDFIFEDSQGTLWMVPHQGGFCYYDRRNRQLKPYYTDYDNPNSKYNPNILNYFLDRQGNLWFCNTWDVTKISFFPHACHPQSIDTGFETRAFLIDKEKNLWTSTKKGSVRIYRTDSSLKGYLTPEGTISPNPVSFSKNIYCFMEDKEGIIWMGSKQDGLFRLERTGNDRFKIRQFTRQKDDPYSLSYNSIYTIFQDSKNRIWVGCYGGGLNLIEETQEGEIRFLHSGNKLTGYSKDRFAKVRYITEANQVLLVGTTEGLLTFSSEFTQPEQIEFYRNIRIPDKVSSLCSNDVIYIYTDSRKDTYVLSFTGGLNKILSENLLSNEIEFKTYTYPKRPSLRPCGIYDRR